MRSYGRNREPFVGAPRWTFFNIMPFDLLSNRMALSSSKCNPLSLLEDFGGSAISEAFSGPLVQALLDAANLCV